MMSNPKGLKNIPAIRQNVAMFLRNICLQVITIHLFGFKVYEFEKIKFFFINIFVGMNILCIFVEIIKKSTTMKKLIFTLIVTLISLVSFSQSSNVDLNEVKKEFMSLYFKRCDSLNHIMSEDNTLMCVAKCQSDYLKTKSGSFITHKQEENPELYRVRNRIQYFYPIFSSPIEIEKLRAGEVITLSPYVNYSKLSNKEVAKRLFNNLIKSEPHRLILDDKTYEKSYFSFGINQSNSIFVVGVVTNFRLVNL